MTQAAVQEAFAAAQEPQETWEQTVIRLAGLPVMEYEQVRIVEAKRLNIRSSALDDAVSETRTTSEESRRHSGMFPVVEPWPEPVDGAALLNDIQIAVRRFIVCASETASVTALWIAFTWVIDHVQVAPLAVITAPEKRCGKSQLLALISKLSRRPLMASNISPSAVFRVIEAHGPTLLIDEVDTFFRDNEELRGIINSGHTRQNAYVIRNVGEDHEPTQFSTWGAKALSGIGRLSDTLMDRAIVLELRRKLPHEKTERQRYAETGLFERLASMLARWAQDNGNTISCARPDLPGALHDRAQDNWEPLLAIADLVGGDWPRLARDAALKISATEQDTTSLSTELLGDIQAVFQRLRTDRIASVDLLSELVKDDEAPWATYNRGKHMTSRQLTKRLGDYAIKSKTIRINGIPSKGYALADFADTFDRYLSSDPSSASVTQLQTEKSPFNTIACDVTDSAERNGYKNPSVTHNYLENNDCNRVTDKTGIAGEERVEVQL